MIIVVLLLPNRIFHGHHGISCFAIQHSCEQIGQRYGGSDDDGVSKLPVVCIHCLYIAYAIFDVIQYNTICMWIDHDLCVLECSRRCSGRTSSLFPLSPILSVFVIYDLFIRFFSFECYQSLDMILPLCLLIFVMLCKASSCRCYRSWFHQILRGEHGIQVTIHV